MQKEKKKRIIKTTIKAAAMIGAVALVSGIAIHQMERRKKASPDPELIMRNQNGQAQADPATSTDNPDPHEEKEKETDPVYVTNRDTVKTDDWEYYIEDGSAIIEKYTGKRKDSINLPARIDSYKVSGFTKGVYFYNREIEEIIIPENIKEIPDSAFEGCSALKRIELPDGITQIKGSTFKGCTSLKSFTIGQNMEQIDMSAFNGCTYLTDIRVSPNNKHFKVKAGILYDRSMSKLLKAPPNITDKFKVPENVLEIGSYAFTDSPNLKNIKFPYSLKTIRAFALYKCKGLEEIRIGKNISKIESDAFFGCIGITKFKTDKFNNTYRTQDGMLINDAKDRIIIYPSGKKNESYTVPDNIAYISSNAFSFTNLKNLYIPESIEIVDDYAFDGGEDCTITINQREEIFTSRSGFNWKKYFKGTVKFQ